MRPYKEQRLVTKVLTCGTNFLNVCCHAQLLNQALNIIIHSDLPKEVFLLLFSLFK